MFIENEKKIIKNFNSHNRNLIKYKNKKKNKIFLVEFNGWSAIHIIFSYVVNFYRNKKNCKIVAYECFDLLNRVEPPWYKNFFWKLGILLNIRTFGIFKSFGTDEFLKPYYNQEQIKNANLETKKFFKKKLSLSNLENYKVNNIWIGDLIYDSYLKKYQKETIDLKSSKFKIFFNDCLKLFYFWNDYFKKNNVEAIAGCHAVYLTGIPLRIADKKNINCFAISSFNCDLVNLKGNISYSKKINGSDIQFKFFKNFLKNISSNKMIKFRKEGKKIIQNIISGKKRYYYLKNSSYNNKKISKTKNLKHRIKVVIFAHDFVDSPHIYGNHFFSDFNQWFDFLNQTIKKTDYDWYIKDHPASSFLTTQKINELLKENKNLKLIEKNFPNNKLKFLGIQFVLTVYGTVASELPIYNIKVINASKNQPHADFNFSINPKNLDEYKKLIMNLKNDKFKIDKKQLYYYHYIKDMFSKKHLFFEKQQKYFGYIANKPVRFTPKVYKYWLDDFNLKRHNQILNNLEKFINEEKYSYTTNEKF